MGNRPFEMFDSPSVLLLDVVAEGVFAALESPPLSVPALVSCFNSAQESWLEIEKSTRTPFWIKWKAEANIQGVYDCNTAAHSLPKNYWFALSILASYHCHGSSFSVPLFSFLAPEPLPHLKALSALCHLEYTLLTLDVGKVTPAQVYLFVFLIALWMQFSTHLHSGRSRNIRVTEQALGKLPVSPNTIKAASSACRGKPCASVVLIRKQTDQRALNANQDFLQTN